MGRPKRIQYAGACYLVILEGNNRQDLFLSNQDRRQFLALLKQYKERHGLEVFAYSLLGNSVSLLVETSQANLSAVMQGFNTQYTKYFNAAHNAVGHVFQGRYKAYVVDKDTHLAEMTRYVHLACVRDALKDKLELFKSSLRPIKVIGVTVGGVVVQDSTHRQHKDGHENLL